MHGQTNIKFIGVWAVLKMCVLVYFLLNTLRDVYHTVTVQFSFHVVDISTYLVYHWMSFVAFVSFDCR